MERTLFNWQNGYEATPREYPIWENDRPATYDQFITLRDTLVYSNKYYASSAGRSLIIWTKLDGTPTNTIEIREPNIMSQKFKSDWTSEDDGSTWTYVTTWWHISINPISCEIMKTGRYRLQHKEQFNSIPSTITRVHSFILHHHGNTEDPKAVFDWEWNTAGEIKRLTAFGYRECNLEAWDWLELKVESSSWTSIISQIAPNSNWWMVEYIDLAY